MRVIDGVADLTREIQSAREVERPLTRDHRLERLARDELHHDEKDVLLFLGGEDGDDVRVIERGKKPRLAQQLAEIDALLVRHFERDLLVDPGVFGEIHRAKAAAADRRKDFVFADDLSPEEHRRAEYSTHIPSHRSAALCRCCPLR